MKKIVKQMVSAVTAGVMSISLINTVMAEDANIAFTEEAFFGGGTSEGGNESYITDGNWNTLEGVWVSGAGAYYGIKFDEPTTINKIVFTTSDNNSKSADSIATRVKSAKVQWSNDMNEWHDIELLGGGAETVNYSEVPNSTGSSGEARRNYRSQFYFEDITAQYFRILTETDTSTQCMEIEAYKVSNMALRHPAVCGGGTANPSSGQTNAYKNVSDGNKTTAAYVDGKEIPPYFGVDLLNEKTFNRVVVYVGETGGKSRITQAKLQYSNDGSEWTDIDGTGEQLNTVTTETNSAGKKLYMSEFKFTEINARYVRLLAEEYTNPQVYEFEVYNDAEEDTENQCKITGQRVEAEGLEGLAVGGSCTVEYNNAEADTEKTTVQWYKSLLEDGEYEIIPEAASRDYVIPEELGGYYIKAKVNVKNSDGNTIEELYTDPELVKYRLAFVDEFDYEAENGEDEEFLSHGWVSDKSLRVLGTPKTYCVRVPENVEVKDGKLRLITRQEHLDKYDYLDKDGIEHTWSTGNVYTNEAFGPYGVYDCSYKLAPATGLNQSFWAMTKTNTTEADRFLELDFNEGHYPRNMATNLHRMEDTTRKMNSKHYYPFGNTETSPTFADEFIRVTGMLKENNNNYTWDAQQNSDTYQVFFNNKNMRKSVSLQYVPAPVAIYCSVAVYPGGFAGVLDEDAANGSVMEVDWVRFYEFLTATPADLEREIISAEELADNAVIGQENGQYSQESVDALREAIEKAKSVTADNVESGLDELEQAVGTFLRSVVGGYVVHVEEIKFQESSVQLPLEYSKQLKVDFTPSYADNLDVTYVSSDPETVSVDNTGKITALKKGSAVITATSADGGKTATCNVTVTDLPANQVLHPVTGGKIVFDKSSKSIIGYTGEPTEITVPSIIDGMNVESIGTNAFNGLKSLKRAEFESGITRIGDWSFNECTALEEVKLPDTLQSINTGAFLGCNSLKEITFPATLNNLEETSFGACTSLIKAVFEGDKPTTFETRVFTDNADGFKIYYNEGAEGFTYPTWNGYNTEIIGKIMNVSHSSDNDNEIFNVTINEENVKSNIVIVAVYNENGELLTVNAQQAQTELQINVPKNTDAKSAKVMLWNSFENGRAETKAFETEI